MFEVGLVPGCFVYIKALLKDSSVISESTRFDNNNTEVTTSVSDARLNAWGRKSQKGHSLSLTWVREWVGR